MNVQLRLPVHITSLVLTLGLFSAAIARSSSSVCVIPCPDAVEVGEGVFRFAAGARVLASGKAQTEAAKLVDYLAGPMGYRLRLVEASVASANGVWLSLESSLSKRLGDEGYELEVTGRSIVLRAAEPAGLFWGIQTLRQLLPPAVFGDRTTDGIDWVVPCVHITDRPRFGWRGLLIDPARHFIPVEDVQRFIDLMVLHKFNRLQIHLTDNEGWRIEIKEYPDLAQLGSKMDWNLRHRGGDGPRCLGFYTQDDIRRIVRYAAERHVTIVPEIEMPYHTGAAIVAYPELGVDTGHLAEVTPEQRWDKTKGLIAPRPKTVAFLQDVLTEVIALFPSEHIHIGGDEANIQHWADDPEMQAQMKHLKLNDAHELHSWFIKQMDAFLAENGRRLVGWDEILQGGLAPGATVMSWRGTSGGISAAKASHDVVMAPTSHTYFDYRQAPDEMGLGRSVIDLRKVYAFEPIPEELDAEQAEHVLGGQAQLWGELIADQKRREFMAYPRAAALSETLWSRPERRDYEQFRIRLIGHLKRLEAAGVNYRPLDK